MMRGSRIVSRQIGHSRDLGGGPTKSLPYPPLAAVSVMALRVTVVLCVAISVPEVLQSYNCIYTGLPT